MANFHTTSSTIGADLQNVGTTQLFALGTRTAGTRDSVWVYVQASTAVTAYKAVAMNTAGGMGMASGADVLGGLQLGVAQTAFVAEEYGWVPIKGSPLSVMTTGSCSVANVVSIDASGIGTGMTSIVTDASCTMLGIAYIDVANQTATTTVATCILTYPTPKSPGGL